MKNNGNLEETKSVVRVGGRMGKKFWTEKRVKQECPLSAILFNLLIANIEKGLGKNKVGGVKLREEVEGFRVCR